MPQYVVSALYHFVILKDYKQLQPPLLKLMLNNEVKGTILLAKEGINGTIAGSREGIDTVMYELKKDKRFQNLSSKDSFHHSMPFYRTRVKLKKEIVTMGVADIDPNHIVGTYVQPGQWNELISDPEVLVVDTRNDYECAIGTFKNAINPKTSTFKEFPEFVKQNLKPTQHKKVAMFCTGGIRCEKSTAYLKQQGFEQVFHLDGGILKYLEEIPEDESLWQGECFVFDNRVAVNHQLEKGQYDQCYACRMPITAADKSHIHYLPGVSCHHCHDYTDEQTKKRFMQREKQIQLAKSRGEEHIGSEVFKTAVSNKTLKKFKKITQRYKNKN